VEFLFGAPVPANRGAGGSGLLGLPPYLEEGVPGLGAPFRSAGSNCGAGTLPYSELVREGLHDLVGLILPLALLYDTKLASGGGIFGAVSIIDGALECMDDTDGW